jgi:hypothetical protein
MWFVMMTVAPHRPAHANPIMARHRAAWGQMRLLFAGLARYDGRLSVLTARNDVPVGLWTVVLRDHVRHTWLCIRRIEQLTADAQENTPLVRWERPLTQLEALAQPENAAMTWLEVLWALGVVTHSARGWSLVAIEAARPARRAALSAGAAARRPLL